MSDTIPDDILRDGLLRPLTLESQLVEWVRSAHTLPDAMSRANGLVELTTALLTDDVIRWRVLDLLGLRTATYEELVQTMPAAPRRNVETVGGQLEVWMREVRVYAHDPAHWVHIDQGGGPSMEQMFRAQVDGWETPVTFCYSVDVVKGRPYRHLTITFRYPGELSQGALNAMAGVQAGALTAWMETFVREVFPFHEATYQSVQTRPPVPVIESFGGGKRRTFYTPIVCRSWVRHDVPPQAAATEVEKDQRRAAGVGVGSVLKGAP